MFTIPITRYIANAAARFSGRNGAVTRQARDQGCSRQTVYNHASEVVEAIQVEHSDGPPRERLLRRTKSFAGKMANSGSGSTLRSTFPGPSGRNSQSGPRPWD